MLVFYGLVLVRGVGSDRRLARSYQNAPPKPCPTDRYYLLLLLRFVYLLISKALPLQSATSPALDRHEYYLYVLVWQDTEEHIQAGDYYTSAASACAALGASLVL